MGTRYDGELAIREDKQFQMTKSAKIAITLALGGVVFFIIIAAGAGTGIYYLIEFQKGKQAYSEGYWAEDDGDYDRAIAKLTEALRHKLTRNDRADAYQRRALAYRGKRKYTEAIRDFSEAIRLYPEWGYAFFARGWAHQCNAEPDQAMADYAHAIRCDPNYGWSYYNRGLLYLRRQQWEPAIRDFDEAIRCLPEEIDPVLARGQGYLGKKDLDRALASFDGAIAVDSFTPAGYLHRSNLYFTKGDQEKHLRDHREAQRLADLQKRNGHKSSAFVPSNYSEVYRELMAAREAEDHDRSIELANRLISMELNWRYASPVVMDRGNAFRAKGDLDRAMVDYDQAITFDPNNAGAHVNRANAWDKKGQPDQALRDYAEAIRLDSKMWEAYFNRASSYRQAGQFDKAIDDLTEVIKLKPEYPPAYINRAADYYRRNEIDKAFRDWNRVTELNANQVEAYLGRSHAYLQQKDHVKAAEEMAKMAQLESKHPDDAFNSLAWLQATCPDKRARNGIAAVQAATKACEMTKWNNEAYIDTLAAAYSEVGDFDKAMKFQQHAMQMTAQDSQDWPEMKKRFRLYQEHKPYREEAKP